MRIRRVVRGSTADRTRDALEASLRQFVEARQQEKAAADGQPAEKVLTAPTR